MTTWNPRANELFLAALEVRSPAERQEYLNGACAGDAPLRAEVDALLEASSRAGGFLESPFSPGGVTAELTSAAERPGTAIGPYKLLEPIGEGGFGVVFMAEQTEPVRRRVALKVLKPGMDTRQVVARFEAERQALAMMDHPNIAKVFDGGATPAGRPYFVMELVKGVPITDFCDRNHLTPRQRLELFVPVCGAVQHAHQKGIIHRDLKPSNVIVVVHDTTAVPKVIDFGIAKALGQELTDKTLFTGFAEMIGTPMYMSPEQAGQSGLDIDTRTDIYSLGVLLYELLTGTTPFRKERFRQAPYDEIRRVIREEDPPKPSTRLSESKETLPAISAQRQTEPAKLTKLLRGELDWIVMKALEKDRTRRYETANGLAMDVQRYLGDEPVLACPPSPGYRLRKFARRNKRVLATAAAFAVLLVAATAVSIGLASWALRERDRAEDRNRESEKRSREAEASLKGALDAVEQMLTRVGDVALVNVPHMEQVRRELLEDALRFLQMFLREQGDRPVIRSGIAIAHRRMGRIQHMLGRQKEAEESYRQAVTLGEQLLAAAPDEPASLDRLADIYQELGAVYADTGRWPQSEEKLLRGVALREQIDRRDPVYPENRADLAGLHVSLVGLYRTTGQLDRAESAFRTSKALLDDLLSRDPTNARYLVFLGSCHQNMALVYGAKDRAADAEAASQKALDVFEQLVRSHPDVVEYRQKLAGVYNNLGIFYGRQRNHSGADAAYQKAIALHEAILRDHPKVVHHRVDVGASYGNMAIHVRQTRSPEESLPWAARAIDMVAPVLEENPLNAAARGCLFEAHVSRAFALRKMGRDEDAAKDWKRAIDLSTGQPHISKRLYRPLPLAYLGEHAQAATEMEALLAEGRVQPVSLYNFGQSYAISSAAAADDARLPADERNKLADHYARRAVELLRQAQARGYFRESGRLTRMKDSKDFDAIRGREDFKTLLTELQAKPNESGKSP